MTAIRAFPERDGCKILVNLESRKLMCSWLGVPSATITRDKVKRLEKEEQKMRHELTAGKPSMNGFSDSVNTFD